MFRDHSRPDAGAASAGGAGDPGGARRPAEHVWVLTGSIGAPTAAMRLLEGIAPGRSLAFIVALRIGSEGVPLICRLLASLPSLRVHAAGVERTPYPQDVLVLPLDGSSQEPGVRGVPLPRNLDEVLGEVAGRYRDKAGVIVLSGIGADGVDGCARVVRNGGRVWIQDPYDCAHASLPQAVRDRCRVDHAGTPEQLAERLMALVPA